MTLQDLLQEIRQRRLILTYNRRGHVVLWAPHTYVPLATRQAIRFHNRALLRLIARSETSVCANPMLHKKSWGYYNRRYACDICAVLLKEVS
jgi:hypothetical protein